MQEVLISLVEQCKELSKKCENLETAIHSSNSVREEEVSEEILFFQPLIVCRLN